MNISSLNFFGFLAALLFAAPGWGTAHSINADGGSPRLEAVRPARARPQNAVGEHELFARSLNGLYFATAARDGRIRCVRAADGVVIHTFYHCSPTALAFSPDGSVLVAIGGAGNQPTVGMWRLPDGKRIVLLVNHSALRTFAERGLPGRSRHDFAACPEILTGPLDGRTRCGQDGRAPLTHTNSCEFPVVAESGRA
jgi:hypothetical protein